MQDQLDKILVDLPRPLIGISSLAVGADQIFAESVLRHGGLLEVIIPFHGYEERFLPGAEREGYLRLLRRADKAIVLPRSGSDEECYLAAGRIIVESSDLVIAVWDGGPARGLGGTGDIVRYALDIGRLVTHINPLTRRVEALSQAR